jgi:hypothetical protein
MKKMQGNKRSHDAEMPVSSFAAEGLTGAPEPLKEQGAVLLAVRKEHVDKKTFRYAVNTCKRIGAHLDILYISPKGEVDEVLTECLSEVDAEGVVYRLMHKRGCLKQEIIDYTNKKKEVLFAVTESSEHLDAGCKGNGKGGKLSKAWQQLKCPLVVVEEAFQ